MKRHKDWIRKYILLANNRKYIAIVGMLLVLLPFFFMKPEFTFAKREFNMNEEMTEGAVFKKKSAVLTAPDKEDITNNVSGQELPEQVALLEEEKAAEDGKIGSEKGDSIIEEDVPVLVNKKNQKENEDAVADNSTYNNSTPGASQSYQLSDRVISDKSNTKNEENKIGDNDKPPKQTTPDMDPNKITEGMVDENIEEQGKEDNYTEEESVERKLTEIKADGTLFDGYGTDEFCIGAEINLSHLEVKAVYDTGEEEIIAPHEYTVEGIDTETAGEKVAVISYRKMKTEIPYIVVEYAVNLHLDGGNFPERFVAENYVVDLGSNPKKEMHKFAGWYFDTAFTMPLEGNIIEMEPGQSQMELYAKWEKLGEFVIDEEGYITSYIGEAVESLMFEKADGMGIRSGAFENLRDADVKKACLTGDIVNLEPGAFRFLTKLESFFVLDKNPMYAADDRVLYTKDRRTLVAFPAGRKEWNATPFSDNEGVPAYVTKIEDYAFWDSSLTELVFLGESPPVLGGSHCFGNEDGEVNIRILVPPNCGEAYRAEFDRYGLGVLVEENS